MKSESKPLTIEEAILGLKSARLKQHKRLGKVYSAFVTGKVNEPHAILGMIVATIQLPEELGKERTALMELWKSKQFKNFGEIKAHLVKGS